MKENLVNRVCLNETDGKVVVVPDMHRTHGNAVLAGRIRQVLLGRLCRRSSRKEAAKNRSIFPPA